MINILKCGRCGDFCAYPSSILVGANAQSAYSTYSTETDCAALTSSFPKQAYQTWSEQERWVWEQVCSGKKADLSKSEKRPSGTTDGCDWGKIEESEANKGEHLKEWSEKSLNFHRLSAKFIQMVLFYEPFRSAYSQKGLLIRCALFDEFLDISDGYFKHSIEFKDSLFKKEINASGLRLEGYFSVTGSTFQGRFNAANLEVASDLFLSARATFKEVNLVGAKVKGRLDASNSTFQGRFNAANLEVASDLFLSARATFKEVYLQRGQPSRRQGGRDAGCQRLDVPRPIQRRES